MFGRKRGAPRALDTPLSPVLAPGLKTIVRNLEVDATGEVWAGYRIGAARWDYTTQAARGALLRSSADTWAALAGRRVRETVTTRPWPVADWAQNLDLRTPHPAPDVPGESFGDYLTRMQHRVQQTGMENRVTYRMFTVGQIDPGVDLRAQVLGRPSREVAAVLEEEARVADVVLGWRAVPMTEGEQGWIRERSLAPGIPAIMRAALGGWASADLPELTNDIRWEEDRLDRAVKVTAWRGGEPVTRYAKVMVATRMGDQSYPENGLEPWQAFAGRLGFSVNWSLAGRLRTGTDMAAEAEMDQKKALAITESFDHFSEPLPEYVDHARKIAKEELDLMGTGIPRDSARFTGTVSVVLTGETMQILEQRAEAFRLLYNGASLRIDFTSPVAQASRLLGTVPGERFDTTGYQRRIRMDYLAAGMPNVSASIGDEQGPYIGHTLGSAHEPVMHDSHYATEGQGQRGRKQNFWFVISTLGGGKSVLLNTIAYHDTRRGGKVIVDDPSGRMMALCEMAELKGVSRAIDLLQGRRGILSPPSLIREPAGGGTESLDQARAQRRALIVDIARRCLEPELYENPATRTVLRRASSGVRWEASASMWDLIRGLDQARDPFASEVADGLRHAADMPLLRLVFPPEFPTLGYSAPDRLESGLTVISTPGVRRASDSTPRSDWSATEHGADVVLRLTSLYTERLLFTKQSSERATMIIDEAESKTDSAVGRDLLDRLGRDHSKENIAVYAAFKNANEQILGGESRNFMAGAFIGQTANAVPAMDMLSLLGIEDESYIDVLLGLSTRRPGEFLHLDADRRVGGFRVDVDYHPELKERVLTNPAALDAVGWTSREGELV
jgi:hypothetical protein